MVVALNPSFTCLLRKYDVISDLLSCSRLHKKENMGALIHVALSYCSKWDAN